MWSKGEDNSTQSHQRLNSPGVLNIQSSILDRQEAQREALVRQTETLCAAEKFRATAVLERLGLSTQQEVLPFYQTPVAHRRRPQSSVRARRIRPASALRVMTTDSETVRRHQWRPQLPDWEEEEEEEEEEQYPDRGLSYSPSASVSTLRAEPRDISLKRSTYMPRTPSPPPPPSPPQLRRVRRIPVRIMNSSEGDKDVGGYRLPTAKNQMEAVLQVLERLKHNSVAPLPQPPAAPKRNSAVNPAPPPKPAPPKTERGTQKTSVRTAKICSQCKKILTGLLNVPRVRTKQSGSSF